MHDYIELAITADPQDADRLCDILLLFDTGGVSVENPQELRDYIATSPTGFDYVEETLLTRTDAVVKVYLPVAQADAMIADIEAAIDIAGRSAPFAGPLRFARTAIDIDSFANAWKDHFHATRIGTRLVIRPSWEAYDAQPDDVVLTIDPGMAFGTGTHETTRLCLEALDGLDLHGKAVLDVGCGSGILGVAASLLGAQSVTMCDLDDGAVKQARENAALNGVAADIFQSDLLASVSGRYDIVCANIVADVIILLLPQLARYLNDGAVALLSGIIGPREQDVRDAAAVHGFSIVRDARENDWVLLVARQS